MVRSNNMNRLAVGATAALASMLSLAGIANGHVYNETMDPYNINKNQTATSVLDYSSDRSASSYTYHPSPDNWRDLPTITILLDKWFDGDPSNNDFFKTKFEHDPKETQLRFGGDIKGLTNNRTLDYLHGMGIRTIYIAGTPWLNMPWQADSYSALDFTLLDPHFGTLQDWRDFIAAVHSKGMYYIADFTIGTMGDLIGFDKFLNSSTPFSLSEHKAVWKLPTYTPWGFTEYPDFKFHNDYNETCVLPRFYLDDGSTIPPPATGCYASDFDQYGDIEAFGVFPDWQRQLAKFASVQDRLREWKTDVNERLRKVACLAIEALDIDGIRIDKATQVTVDALAVWSQSTRECATALGKTNFFIPGEVTGGDTFGSLYYGRGRTPSQLPESYQDAIRVTEDDSQYFIRDKGQAALDGVAFHYSIYRSLARFLGMDGNLNVAYDVDVNFVTAWNQMVVNNDMLNSQTGKFDPRHMFGTTNHDVFRWPALTNGTMKNALGDFVATLLFPGIPLYYYGEEQGMYLFDNGAANYLYGRQPMVSTKAWQRHGCYKLGSTQYFNMPYDRAVTGCDDDWNSLDHFDPTAATRRLIKHMNELRNTYPALLNGLNLVQWGNWTYRIQLPGSNQTQTEIGLWTVGRGPLSTQSNETEFTSYRGDTVWMLYTNENKTVDYKEDCSGGNWISTPYIGGTTVKNLFFPYEEVKLENSLETYYNDTQPIYRGCLPEITMTPYEFKAFVPVATWAQPVPAMTAFQPGHDYRLPSDTNNEIAVSFEYDTELNCDSFTSHLSVTYNIGNSTLQPSFGTANCAPLNDAPASELAMTSNSTWAYSVTLNNAPDGVYEFMVTSGVTAQTGNQTTNSNDYLLIRKGGSDNVMIDQEAGSYSSSLLTESDGKLYINHNAAGADKFRYTIDWGTYWSDWADYETTTEVTMVADKKFWDGDHVEVQYWSEITGSASHVVQGDHGYSQQRGFPQLLARGKFNEWGFDSGATSDLKNDNGIWTIPLMASWPTFIQLNVYGYDDFFYGDTDGDGVLDRLPPNSQSPNYLNMSVPPTPHLAWTVTINDSTGEWTVKPRGHYMVQVILFVLLLVIPPLTAMIAVAIFRYSFYAIKVNKWGIKPKETSYFPLGSDKKKREANDEKAVIPISEKHGGKSKQTKIIGWPEDPAKRRKVLIATLEYEIIDWKIKVKIGGLGVMSSLMGKAMSDCDMLWVVPKVKDLEYPQGEYAEPIEVTIFGEPYLIEVETHQLDNITYIILDSPVFRAQTKADPYPQRMDDLSSAIFYSTWNQAIAEAIRRYPIVDIYHINDYHGALAPLYLLPKVMPVCLSLHNAEFQGLWPLRTKDEMKEVCAAFNISKEICTKYVQFGNTFNLLHAAASYISLHQKSVGVAGVSDKYGKRSWARYPALWTLRNIDSLPNPDPTDIAALDEQPVSVKNIGVDQAAEAKRPEDKRQAQEWAGLKQEADAELFVFVGRWSKQKGVDLIADVFVTILEKKPKVQLIAVGPVIDLYGRFAAEKLARLMEMYPDRVCSKPEFTALPPYLFSGADFALIPSRDEPFGLVAVEFGRKGALGVGSRLGGLGLMPGWWFPVESSATEHMLSQFQKTIKMALKSTQEERAILRARSAVQRFPVVEWRQRLEDFHRRSITASRSISGDMAYYADLELPPAGGLYMNDNASEFSVGGDWRNSTISVPGSPNMAADDRHGMAPSSPLASPVVPAGPDAYGGQFQQQQSHNQNYLTVEDSSKRISNRSSAESFYADDPDRRSAQGAQGAQVPQLYYDQDRSPSADVNPAQHMSSSKSFLRGDRGDGYSSDANDVYEEDEHSDRFHSGPSSDVGESLPYLARGTQAAQSYDNFLAAANRQIAKQSKGVRDPFLEHRQSVDSSAGLDSPSRPFTGHSRNSSFDSISSIMDEKGASSPLNKAIVDFTDSDGEVAQSFVQRLQNLSSDNSKGDLCIEKYLIKSEKAFFDDVKKSRMSSMASVKSSRDSFVQSRAPSVMDGYRPESPYSLGGHESPPHHYTEESYDNHEQHAPDVPMTRMQIFMNRSVGGWPLYTIIMSIGQLLSATSFQLTLLTGNNSQTNTDLYIIGAIFFVASLAWYILFRMRPSVWVLALPWTMFSIAFFLIGLPSLHGPFTPPQKIITSIATWFYAVASAAGFLFFGCNFGEEAGAATEVWVLRACIVQGLQQVWVSALWYWGSTMAGRDPDTYITPVYIIYAVWPLSVMSIIFSYLMFFGLPDYYRQVPPYVPNFFKTLFRRKLVIWFMVAEILRDYWLSGPYGRNWSYLWNNQYIPKWAIVVLIAIFFVGLWILIMGTLIKFSKIHSWLMPIFAVGLGCPRWCQMLWGVSGVALYIPWGGVAGPYLGTCLWLWLGVLDAVQGVGLGMILLQTLSRLHVCATLAIAQMLGSVVVIIARATAPNRNGPGGVFPDAALWDIAGGDGSMNPLGHWDFWVALVCQIIIIVGYFIFFRKEQLSKP